MAADAKIRIRPYLSEDRGEVMALAPASGRRRMTMMPHRGGRPGAVSAGLAGYRRGTVSGW